MALPAGRYGVTKNQLLKIKKLPMNTIKLIEELTEKFNLLGTAAFKNSISVVTESSDLVESGAVYTALQGKVDNSVIGTVEGANASKAWSVGEHFISGGQFKEVTQPIASGGAISDSNTVDKPIADCLVKQEAFTITTTAGGLANLTNQNSRIILRIDSANSKICFPYRTTSGTNNIIVFNNDMTIAANLEVSGTYYYI